MARELPPGGVCAVLVPALVGHLKGSGAMVLSSISGSSVAWHNDLAKVFGGPPSAIHTAWYRNGIRRLSLQTRDLL